MKSTCVMLILSVLVSIFTIQTSCAVKIEKVEFSTSHNQTSDFLIFMPDDKEQNQEPYPAVYYSYTGYRTLTPYMLSTARFLVQNGIACGVHSKRIFEKGPGREIIKLARRDADAAVCILQQHERINPKRIGFMGHSFGANVVDWACVGVQGGASKAVVLLGMVSSQPQPFRINTLIGIGAMDELRPYNEAIGSLQTITGKHDVIDGVIYGNIKNFTAKKFVVSPFSSHITEVYDPVLITSSLNWFRKSFSLTSKKKSTSFHPYLFALIFRFLISIAVFLLTKNLGAILLKKGKWDLNSRVMPSLLFLVFLLLSWILPYSIMAKEIIFSLIMSCLLINRSLKKDMNSGKLFLFILIIILCFIPGLFVNSFQFILHHPEKTLELIVGLLMQIIMLPAVGYENLSTIFCGGLRPFHALNSILTIILIAEILFPGFGSNLKIFKKESKKIDRNKIWIFLILFVIMIILFVIRFSQGFIDTATIMVLKRVFLRVIIIPVLIFALVTRTVFWKKLTSNVIYKRRPV